MESEEFYDSLDESSDHESISSFKSKRTSKNRSDPNVNCEESIPFYSGNLSVPMLDFSKDSSSCSGSIGRSTKRKSSRCSRVRKFSPKMKPKKGYLDIYYDKTGTNKYDEAGYIECDSSRPTCSSLSPKSFITCDGDVECDQVFDVDLKSDSEPSLDNKEAMVKRVPLLNLHVGSGMDDFKLNCAGDHINPKKSSICSISSVNTKKSTASSKTTDSKAGKVNFTNSKLDIWRKRQQYGRKVSETNRIHFQEKKALESLQKELINNNICV